MKSQKHLGKGSSQISHLFSSIFCQHPLHLLPNKFDKFGRILSDVEKIHVLSEKIEKFCKHPEEISARFNVKLEIRERCKGETVQRSTFCRSRRELSNQYFLAKFGFDTAENKPYYLEISRSRKISLNLNFE